MGDVATAGPGASIQVQMPTGAGTVVSLGTRDELAALYDRFGRDHCVSLPGFFDPHFLNEITPEIERANFYRREHGKIGSEGCMEANATLARLLFGVNDHRLFDAIDAITGCGGIGCFDGRVYRLGASGTDRDSWHSDLGDNRLVALSVNVGTESYRGGTLQIRDAHSRELLHEARPTHPGDALLFRLAADLEHQVTSVEGSTPRTAFAGWFKSRPSFRAVIEGRGWSAR
jgi:hypothetical protein